jgi:tRNA modification GTPase
VVLAGATNVGKSSLINALAGYERAIVSPQPGTTRDVVTTRTAIAGWPVQLCDTAGLREAADALESAGVALAAGALMDADLVIVVHDASAVEAPEEGDRHILLRGLRTTIAAMVPGQSPVVAALPAQVRLLHVHNKMDLVDASGRRAFASVAGIATSAVTSEGLPELVEAIARALVPLEPAPGAAVPFTVEQVAVLEAAREAVGRQDQSALEAALHALL